jgi:hypothetical protein
MSLKQTSQLGDVRSAQKKRPNILLGRLRTSSLQPPHFDRDEINQLLWAGVGGYIQERTELIAVSVSNVTRPHVHLLPVSFFFFLIFFRVNQNSSSFNVKFSIILLSIDKSIPEHENNLIL